MTHPLVQLMLALHSRVAGSERERGDVPGWVLVTIMSAALVMGILAVAGPALTDAIQTAIDRVVGEL